MMGYKEMLEEILKTSHWTQEQLSVRLGVSFATINAWLNGRAKPRESAIMNIRRLYLAQDITKEVKPVYITLVNIPSNLMVEDYVLLEKEPGGEYDDEAIRATVLDYFSEDDESNRNSEWDAIAKNNVLLREPMFVANSVATVARGTYSAGRIYDKFDGAARAQVLFIAKNIAIARVVDWNASNWGVVEVLK